MLRGGALGHGYELRLVEQMPLEAQHQWSREAMITGEEIVARLDRELVLAPAEKDRGIATAQ